VNLIGTLNLISLPKDS